MNDYARRWTHENEIVERLLKERGARTVYEAARELKKMYFELPELRETILKQLTALEGYYRSQAVQQVDPQTGDKETLWLPSDGLRLPPSR